MTSLKPDERLLQNDDTYPSRLFPAPSIQQRLDPVIYGREEPPIDSLRLNHYRRSGFMVLQSLFSTDEIDSFSDELNRILQDKRVLRRHEAVTAEDDRLRSLYRIHQISQLFSELATDRRIVRIAEYILGSAVYLHQSRICSESGLHGSTDYWHSDFETWHSEDGMPRMRALSVAIMLSETGESNGPLMFVPGSHCSFVACVHGSGGTPDDASIRYLINDGGIETPKGKPGTVIVFDCNTMHGANSNITPYPRKNLYIVYNSVDNPVSEPFSGDNRRPEHRAARSNVAPVKPGTLTLVK